MKIPWNTIQDFYRGEWVELTNVEWSGEAPFPKRAQVRQHAPSRGKLLEKIRVQERESQDSIVLYITPHQSYVEREVSA